MKWRRRFFFLTGLLMALAGCQNGFFGNAPWSSGDRVLVAKCLYDTDLAPPQRYDVVVFKFPKGPVEKGTPKNYIKRLIGLHGEIIAILFGRLYRFGPPAPGESPVYDDVELAKKANEEAKAKGLKVDHLLDLWKAEKMHSTPEDGNEKSLDLFEAGKFEILRKPPQVQMSMRRIVYDNDYPAKDLLGVFPPRWQPTPKGDWKADEANGFVHGGAKGQGIDWMRYHHLLRPREHRQPIGGLKAPQPQLITDELGYNSVEGLRRQDSVSPNWVGDLMLECHVNVTKPEGSFWIELSRGIDRFRAKFDLTTGQCTLYRQPLKGKEVELGTQPTALKGPGRYDVRLANFDARLTLWVNRDLPFGDGKDYPPPDVRDTRNELDKNLTPEDLARRRGPTANDLEPASIGSEGATLKVNQIRLWRDTYYIRQSGFHVNESPSAHDAFLDPDSEAWSSYRLQKPATYYVQPGHYLCLGDNSARSSDGRDWGLVPERLMLGRALLVYFPFNRAGAIR